MGCTACTVDFGAGVDVGILGNRFRWWKEYGVKSIAYMEIEMGNWKFVWPEGQVSPEYQSRIEAAMSTFLTSEAHGQITCHEGAMEVCIALGTSRGKIVNAVLVCACGVPRATLETRFDSEDSWELAPLQQSA